MVAAGSENPGAYLKQSPDSSTIDDTVESEFSRKRRCCFYTPIHFFTSTTLSNPNPTSSSSSTSPGGGRCWQRISGTGDGNNEFMVVRAWKKMREWSEIIAGPKWKNFIRRMGKPGNRPMGCRIGLGNHHQQQQGKFGYDPLSYAMNFDEGKNSPSDEMDIGFRNFSSRYASFPSSAKSSMDLGKENAPSFL